jgi:hypothetical protein
MFGYSRDESGGVFATLKSGQKRPLNSVCSGERQAGGQSVGVTSTFSGALNLAKLAVRQKR